MARVWKTAGKGLLGTHYARKERKRELQYKKRECIKEVRMEQRKFWGNINGRGLENGWKGAGGD